MDETPIWIKKSHYSVWMLREDIYRQLPWAFRFFAFMRHRVPSTLRRIISNYLLFRIARKLHSLSGANTFHPINIGAVTVWLDLTDPRFIRAPLDFIRVPTIPQILSLLLKEGSAFVDVGSNHGTFSISASMVLAGDDLIIAIEPQPRMAKTTTLALRDGRNRRSFVYNCALGDKEGVDNLFVPKRNSGEASLYKQYSGINKHVFIPVSVRTLDDILGTYELPIGFVLKIDAEGSEFVILKGGQKIIRKCKPVLILEINKDALSAAASSVGEIFEFLLKNDYQHFADIRDPLKLSNLKDSINIFKTIVVT